MHLPVVLHVPFSCSSGAADVTGAAEDTEPTASQLRWRCRRGMRELDTLLTAWVEQCWPVADRSSRARFLELLDAEDDRLWDWVTGRGRPDDDALAEQVQRVVERRP
ncbi:FAD assembly factor SdhE [Halomonas denitrificans]|nr:succinate dehydrogenase assembly factor 2 [Halomonas denitrificans]